MVQQTSAFAHLEICVMKIVCSSEVNLRPRNGGDDELMRWCVMDTISREDEVFISR